MTFDQPEPDRKSHETLRASATDHSAPLGAWRGGGVGVVPRHKTDGWQSGVAGQGRDQRLVLYRETAGTRSCTRVKENIMKPSLHPHGTVELRREKPAMSQLIEDLGTNSTVARNRARLWLVSMKRKAVPALIEALETSNVHGRAQAAKALGEIGDPSAAPVLVKALEDEEFSVNWVAAEALIAIGREALPALLQALIERPSSIWLREGAHVVFHAEVHEAWRETVRPLLQALNGAAPEAELPQAAREALRVLPQRNRK